MGRLPFSGTAKSLVVEEGRRTRTAPVTSSTPGLALDRGMDGTCKMALLGGVLCSGWARASIQPATRAGASLPIFGGAAPAVSACATEHQCHFPISSQCSPGRVARSFLPSSYDSSNHSQHLWHSAWILTIVLAIVPVLRSDTTRYDTVRILERRLALTLPVQGTRRQRKRPSTYTNRPGSTAHRTHQAHVINPK